jgi:hypothetical protein
MALSLTKSETSSSRDSCASLPPSSPHSLSTSTSCSSSSYTPDTSDSLDSTESCAKSGLTVSSSPAGSVVSCEVLTTSSPAHETEAVHSVIGGLKGWFTWANNYQQQQEQHFTFRVSCSFQIFSGGSFFQIAYRSRFHFVQFSLFSQFRPLFPLKTDANLKSFKMNWKIFISSVLGMLK